MRAAKARPASVGAVLALALAGSLPARAQADEPRAGATEAGCPDPEAVRSALRKLASKDDPDRLVTAAAEAGLVIEDLEDRMRVSVAGRARTYHDAAHDCERRARLAAVFAALVLTPGSADAGEANDAGETAPVPPPPPPATPVPVVVAAPSASQQPRAEIAFDAGPALAIARHRGATLVSPAVMIGAWHGGARWRVGLAAGVPILPATFSIGGTAVSLTRYPLRLSLAASRALGRLRAAAEAGAVLSLLRVERTGPPPGAAATRVEPGVHVGAELLLPAGRLGVYLAVASDWIPRTYPITLDPEGEVDRTPALWFSGEAGLRISFH